MQAKSYQGPATIEKVSALARRRGFVYPGSDIYGGLGSSYDYGHYGVLTKQNVKALWQRAMLERDDVVALDSSIIMHPDVWVASGHAATFSDPLVDCKTCKQRFRADHLDVSACGQKPSKHAGDHETCQLTEARDFNLMFETQVGPTGGSSAYLRPETAQGIFVNFKNVCSSLRVKPPFGIAQIGKSFRNEITPSNFLFRTREFEQMEMEFFVPPDEAPKWYDYWVKERYDWYVRNGIRPSHLRIREHDSAELAHYADATSDIEYLFPAAAGWSELEGVANRTDYDLKAHAKKSGKTLEYVGHEERYVPYVIEPAAGADRAFLAFLVDAYDEDEIAGSTRVVLRLHPALAPVKAAVLPIVKNDARIVEEARALYARLGKHVPIEYDEGRDIGARYRRQDEIGTPWAFTVDHQTLEDQTVTVRDRDTLKQERISVDRAREWLFDKLEEPWSPRA